MIHTLLHIKQGFPGGSEGKASACNAEEPASIPRSDPENGNGHHSFLKTLRIEVSVG